MRTLLSGERRRLFQRRYQGPFALNCGWFYGCTRSLSPPLSERVECLSVLITLLRVDHFQPLLNSVSVPITYSRQLVVPTFLSLLSSWKFFVEPGLIFAFQKLSAECQSAGYSGTLIPYKCDLSNEEEILSMFSAIKTLHKGVDVCINNAGLAHNEPLLSGKTEGWRNMIDVGGSPQTHK